MLGLAITALQAAVVLLPTERGWGIKGLCSCSLRVVP